MNRYSANSSEKPKFISGAYNYYGEKLNFKSKKTSMGESTMETNMQGNKNYLSGEMKLNEV